MIRRLPILLLAAACAPPPPPAAPSPPGPALDAEERSVLAAVVDNAAEGAPFVVFEDSTRTDQLAAEMEPYVSAGLEHEAHLPASDVAEMLRDYHARNRVSVPFPVDLSRAVQVRTYNRHASMSGGSATRDSMIARFAPARYFHGVSRPGFDRGRNAAVVTRAFWCPGLCGWLGVTVLRRGSGGWRVVDNLTLVIS